MIFSNALASVLTPAHDVCCGLCYEQTLYLKAQHGLFLS